MFGFFVKVARFKQGLARDAAHPQAGSTESRVFVDASSVDPELGRSDGCDVTGWATTQYHQLVFDLAHLVYLFRGVLDRMIATRLLRGVQTGRTAAVGQLRVLFGGLLRRGLRPRPVLRQ